MSAKQENQDLSKELFEKMRKQLLMFDPVAFCEEYLTLDGKPFRIHGNGYKPFAEIYRYIGIKMLEKDSKPLVILKARQTGFTTMASALEMYFMGCGLFGNSINPPIRILHSFPLNELAAAYSKTKLNTMINQSIMVENGNNKNVKTQSYMSNLIDKTSESNNSLSFKQFQGGNHLWIESIGIDGDRVMGRMTSLETELPTPNGFVKLKDLKEGDQLFDERGNICNITKLHPIDYSPISYRITFDDGTTVDACKDHLWLTHTKQNRIGFRKLRQNQSKYTPNPTIKTTEQILQTLTISSGQKQEINHTIPNCYPLQYSKKQLLLDPYLFGLWLGDGCQKGTIETADPEILVEFSHHVIPSSVGRVNNSFGQNKISKSCAYRVVGLTTKLGHLKQLQNTHSKIGDYYNKHIPDEYMRGSFKQRLALLQGLLDTDGHCDKNGNIEFVQVRKELAYQVYELVLGLGIKATIVKRESWRNGKRHQDKFRIRFFTHLPVFRMKRKLERIKPYSLKTDKSSHRFITNIEPIDPIPMRCITVDSSSHLYLITRQCIPTHNTADALFVDELQRTNIDAISSAAKILTTSKYGVPSKGIQVLFGTPRRKGSDFERLWNSSSQQYYYLGCEKCKEYFPLYTPNSSDWEKIWIYEYTVKCPKCGFEQDKLQAQERGCWISTRPNDDPNVKMIGFHLNQLYMPMFSREQIEKEKPGKHPTNTERLYHNEVLGEFFQGDSSPITTEEIREFCGDDGRKFSPSIMIDRDDDSQICVLGIDYGQKADLEQLRDTEAKNTRGQSYSTAVVLLSKGPGLLSIEFATKFKKNDIDTKKELIEQLMRRYSIQLVVADIGDSFDFSPIMHNAHGDRYLVSRATGKVADHVKFRSDVSPKEIQFEKSHAYGEVFAQMKKGMIRFPMGDYEKVGWLIEHCASMEIKPKLSHYGDPEIHYVKGSMPNDGFTALVNAYLAYKWIITRGFVNNNQMPGSQISHKNKPLVTGAWVDRKV